MKYKIINKDYQFLLLKTSKAIKRGHKRLGLDKWRIYPFICSKSSIRYGGICYFSLKEARFYNLYLKYKQPHFISNHIIINEISN